MSYRELLPHPALRPFVDRLWVSASDAPTGPRRILPDGCIDLIVDLLDGARAQAVGTMTRAVMLRPAPAVRLVGVRFRPGGARPFLRLPADDLTDRVPDAADVGARWLAPERLAPLTDPDEAARALERTLLARLAVTPPPDPIVAYTVQALFGPAAPTVAALERRTGWSRQHLGRVFRREVGVSPKQLARVARMQRAVGELHRDPRGGLADTAARLGYFDQAHMALEFRQLVGLTPAQARAAAGSIFPIPSLLVAG